MPNIGCESYCFDRDEKSRSVDAGSKPALAPLRGTCQQTLLALEAAANVLDTDMTDDLTAMIARSERELEVLDAKITAAGG